MQSLTLLCLFVLIRSVIQVSSAMECPVTNNFTGFCTCDEWQVNCAGLGDHDVFPAIFVSLDNHIFSNITISSSWIRTIQKQAIGQIKTREIFLMRNGIEMIEDYAFINQSNELEALYLHDNQIRIIERYAFSNLKKLIRLTLNDNLITTIEAGLFADLVSLRNLYLQQNQIESIHSTALPRNLIALTMYRNRLQTIPADVFSQDNLTLLNLRENRFKHLPENLFEGLPALTDLDLSWNNLTLIGKNLFAKNQKLRRLDLAINNIDTIHPEALSTLANLQFLDMSNNKLDSIPGPLFANLTSLLALYLSHNFLTTLPDEMSSGMHGLITLYLHSNRLISIGRTPFLNLVVLNELRLDHNKIGEIKFAAFDHLGKLTRIDLSDNLITSLFDDPFESSVHLEWVDLSYNRINAIPTSYFRNLSRIEFLDLSHNHIQSLSRDSFVNQTFMKHLNLTGNWLQTIDPGTFAENTQLTFLSLASNPLQSLDSGVFKNLISLNTLLVNNTCITELPPDVFQDASGIQYITLQNSRLRSVRNETFSELNELLFLDLSKNKIAAIESGAFAAPRIEAIKLSHNNIDITALRAATALFSYTVRLLDVSYNNVTELTGITPRIFDEIDAVFFAGNPFSCDCDSNTYWVRSLLSLKDFGTAGCSTPSDKAKVKLVCFEENCQNNSFLTYPFQDSCRKSLYVEEDEATSKDDDQIVIDVCDPSRYITTIPTTTEINKMNDSRSLPKISITLKATPIKGQPRAAQLSWNVASPAGAQQGIKGYAVSFERIRQSDIPVPVYLMSPGVVNYNLTNLEGNTDYRLCVRVVVLNGYNLQGGSDCTNLHTDSVQEPRESYTMIIALAVSVVVAVIVLILIIAGLCLRRQRKRTGPKEVGIKKVNSSLSTRPQTWLAPDVTLVGGQNGIDGGKGGQNESEENKRAKDAAEFDDKIDIWMDDDGEINFGSDMWVENDTPKLTRSMSVVDPSNAKAKKNDGKVKRSNSTLASAGMWAASFNDKGSNTTRLGSEALGEQTMLSLNIFDNKSHKMDGKHPEFGK